MERQPEQPEALRAGGRIYITGLTGADADGWEPPELTFESPPLGDDWVDLGYVDETQCWLETQYWQDIIIHEAIREHQETVARIVDNQALLQHYVYDGDGYYPLAPPGQLPYGGRATGCGRLLGYTTPEDMNSHVYEYDGDLICETCWLKSEQIYSGCNLPKHKKMEPVEWV